MSWCPKCKSEFQDEIKICHDCQVELITALPNEEREASESFLILVKDELEAGIIEAKLQECGIPVLKKHPGTGEYLTLYMGYTPFGIELYVPTKALSMAREMIAVEPVTDEAPDLEDETEFLRLRESCEKASRFRGWVLFGWFILLPWLIGIIIYLVNRIAF